MDAQKSSGWEDALNLAAEVMPHRFRAVKNMMSAVKLEGAWVRFFTLAGGTDGAIRGAYVMAACMEECRLKEWSYVLYFLNLDGKCLSFVDDAECVLEDDPALSMLHALLKVGDGDDLFDGIDLDAYGVLDSWDF